jgi:hypothetical protein
MCQCSARAISVWRALAAVFGLALLCRWRLEFFRSAGMPHEGRPSIVEVFVVGTVDPLGRAAPARVDRFQWKAETGCSP